MGDLIALFGRRVRVLRKARGMTLEALGRAANIGFKHIAEIERGVKVPSFDAIEGLAAALKAEPYELFLPERHAAGDSDRHLSLVIRDVLRHATPAMQKFLTEVVVSARQLEKSAR